MEKYTFTIYGRLDALNEYTKACRGSWQHGSEMKKKNEKRCMDAIQRDLPNLHLDKKVNLHFLWIEQNRKRDKDNISSFGRKCIQDALVKTGVLQNDGWDNVEGFRDSFAVDKNNPRIVVTLETIC